MCTKVLAAELRQLLKREFPLFTFSVRSPRSDVISVSCTRGPCPAYKLPEEWTEQDRREMRARYVKNTNTYNIAELDMLVAEEFHARIPPPDHMQLRHEELRVAIDFIDTFLTSRNYDNSDVYRDFVDVGFYFFGVKIGQWDKPYINTSAMMPSVKERYHEQ